MPRTRATDDDDDDDREVLIQPAHYMRSEHTSNCTIYNIPIAYVYCIPLRVINSNDLMIRVANL